MPADPERTAAIEGSIARTLRFAGEELAQSPDRAASKLSQATTQLDSSDAREHLSPESIAKFRAQVAEMQLQVEAAERAEVAARVERDVRRMLSNLADEIGSNGSQIESYLERASARLTKDDARASLAPETIATLQQELNALYAKAGATAPPMATPVAAPQRAAPAPVSATAPPASAPPAVSTSAAASTPPPAAEAMSEEAQRFANSIARTLRMAAGEIDSPGWRQIEGQLGQAATQLQSDEINRLVPAATLDGFRTQLAQLESQFAAHDREEKAAEVEDYLRRLLNDAEQHIDWTDRIGGMLEKITEVINDEKAQTYLPADRVNHFRAEVTRVAGLAGGSQRQSAIDDATAPLTELEQRVTDSMFEGLDEYAAQKLWADLDVFKNRVGYALEKLPADDSAARDLRARLDAVVARWESGYGATKHAAVMSRVTAAWNETLAKVAGWEDETQDTGAVALGGDFMPRTQTAVRTLRDALSGSSLHSPIPDARQEYAADPAMKKIIAEGEAMINTGLEKMTAAFEAIMDAAEDMPTPTGEFDLRKGGFMTERAREAFAETSHEQPRVARATALVTLWDDTLEAVRLATAAYYEKLSSEAAVAWPPIASRVKAEDGFNPLESTWGGKAVRISGFYNRMRWDFTGDFHFATWVNDTPVAGDFEPHVLDAFNEAEKNIRTSIDDHLKWDAIVIVGGAGKLKQRFKTKVKKGGELVGEIEEWRPVDCVTCRVIALRAGPVAVGPQ